MNTLPRHSILFDTYSFIKAHILTRGYAPTLLEIGATVGGTEDAVCKRLRRLERLGYVQRGRGWRNIRLAEVKQ